MNGELLAVCVSGELAPACAALPVRNRPKVDAAVAERSGASA